MGLTPVSYLCGGRSRGSRNCGSNDGCSSGSGRSNNGNGGLSRAMAGAAEAVVGTAMEAVGTTATVAGVAVAVATILGLGLDPPTRGGEEWLTRGLKLCPSLVLTMLGPEKGRR